MRYAHLSLFLAMVHGILLAQQVEVTRYDVDHGLPQSMVNHVLQDSDGFIWFGTGDGLARFDGQRFVVYKHDGRDSTSLSNNRIWGLAEADERHLWVGTRSGLDRMDRRTGCFEHMPVGEPDGCWQVLDVRAEGSLFYSPLLMEFLRIAEGGMRRWPSGHHDSYAHRVEDDGRTVFQFQRHDTVLRSGARDTVAVRLPVDTTAEISSFLRYGEGWLFFGQRGSYQLDEHFRLLPVPAELAELLAAHEGVKHAERAPDGRLWLGLSGHGMLVLDSALRIVQRYPLLPLGQGPLRITVIAFDRQGNTWVGTDGKGVFKIAPERIKVGRMMPGQGLPWEPASWFVRGFAQWDAHRVLVNFFQGGSAVFDERTGTLGPAPLDPRTFGSSSNYGASLRDVEGRIWMQEGREIRCIDPRTGQEAYHYTATCGDRMLRLHSGELLRISICHPPEHLIPGDGPVRFRPEPLNAAFATISKQVNMPGTLVHDALGRYWICSDAMPVQVFTENDPLPRPFDERSVPQQLVRLNDLDDDGTYLWMCTNDGLVQLERKDLRIIRYWTVHDGLPDQFLYGMEPAGDGTWWISTNNGLCHFDPRTGFRNYGTADGLQSKEYNSHAHFRSASGRLYFGGVNGFDHFGPGPLPTDTDLPVVRAIALHAGDHAIALEGDDRNVELPYPRNTLRIELAVLEFTAPEHNRYKWRMKGYRDAWTEAPSATPIELNNVPAGSFTLEVVGINGDGVEGATNALLGITVVRPFWASPWAIALVCALVIGAIAWGWALAYRKRMHARLLAAEREMKELRMRTRLAKDIHDDVGSGLARLAALSRSPKRSTDADARFEKVGDISSELLDNLRDVVWMNDPRNGTLDLLVMRLREFAQDLFEDSNTTVICDFPDPLPTDPIGGAFRRNVMLIGREALHNARKYSHAQHVTLHWRSDAEAFDFAVTDDGVGLGSGAAQGSGHGTENMQQRAEELHAHFERSTNGAGGTTVRVFGRSSCLHE